MMIRPNETSSAKRTWPGRRFVAIGLLAALACWSLALAAPLGPATPPTKRVVIQPYFNRIFECRFPLGWTLETNPDALEKVKTKFVLARRPGTQSQMSVQFFSYLHPRFPTVNSYLKANSGGAKVARKRISKHRRTRGWVFKRPLAGGTEAVVLVRLTRKGSYCVFRYFADSRNFEQDKQAFNRLVKSFKFRLRNQRRAKSTDKAGPGVATKGAATRASPAKTSPSKGKRLQSNDRFAPRLPDGR